MAKTKHRAGPGPNRLSRHPLPKSRELEQLVLGSALVSHEAVPQLLATLTLEDFYWKAHQLIFQAIEKLANQEKPIDPAIIADYLESQGQLESIGGRAYLASLANRVVTTTALEHQIKLLRKKTISRALIQKGIEISALGYDGIESSNGELLQQAYQRLEELEQLQLERAEPIDPVRHLEEWIKPMMEKGGPTGLRTGFSDLDRLIIGLHPGEVMIIAARPAVGKTSLALSILNNVCKEGYRGAIFSLEMGAAMLWERLLSMNTGVKLSRIRSGRLTAEQFQQLKEEAERLKASGIVIAEDFEASFYSIQEALIRFHEKEPLDLAIIDYIQLVNAGGGRGGVGGGEISSRNQELGAISRGFKVLAAKKLRIPIILLSQLNREIERRASKIPKLSDLRDSGGLEADADIVAILSRDTSWEEEHGVEPTDLFIVKQRNGPTGRIELVFKKEFAAFYGVAKGDGDGDGDRDGDEDEDRTRGRNGERLGEREGEREEDEIPF